MRPWRNWQTRTFEGRVVHTVRVQVSFLAPNSTNPNPRPIGEGFGFVVYFGDPNLTSGDRISFNGCAG